MLLDAYDIHPTYITSIAVAKPSAAAASSILSKLPTRERASVRKKRDRHGKSVSIKPPLSD
jgi:hypothetical protein